MGAGAVSPALSWRTDRSLRPPGARGVIRQRIVEADLVDAIVALPPQLFLTTGIPVSLWFLTRDKTGRNLRASDRARTGETLFIDAHELGTMETRALRVLTGDEDVDALLSPGCATLTTTQTSVGLSTPSANGGASRARVVG